MRYVAVRSSQRKVSTQSSVFIAAVGLLAAFYLHWESTPGARSFPELKYDGVQGPRVSEGRGDGPVGGRKAGRERPWSVKAALLTFSCPDNQLTISRRSDSVWGIVRFPLRVTALCHCCDLDAVFQNHSLSPRQFSRILPGVPFGKILLLGPYFSCTFHMWFLNTWP